MLEDSRKEYSFDSFKTKTEAPIVSLFRHFSAPVNWQSDLSNDEYLTIIKSDNDQIKIIESSLNVNSPQSEDLEQIIKLIVSLI